MTLEEKDAYIAEHLMKLQSQTLRFMVADLTSEVERLTASALDWACRCGETQAQLERVAGEVEKARGAGSLAMRIAVKKICHDELRLWQDAQNHAQSRQSGLSACSAILLAIDNLPAPSPINTKSCEWTSIKDALYYVGCRDKNLDHLTPFYTKGYQFCPYCGKPIKIKG